MHEIDRGPGREGSGWGEIAERWRRLVAGCFSAFAVLLVIAFLAVWVGMRASQREARDSLGWPTVPGAILESEVVEHEGLRATDERPTKRFGTTYRPRVRYEYTVGGTRQEGGRIEVFQTLYGTREEAEARLAPYPVGGTVEVRHDPESPARAVLEPGPETFDNTYFFAFGGGFLAIAVVLAIVLRSMLAPRR